MKFNLEKVLDLVMSDNADHPNKDLHEKICQILDELQENQTREEDGESHGKGYNQFRSQGNSPISFGAVQSPTKKVNANESKNASRNESVALNSRGPNKFDQRLQIGMKKLIEQKQRELLSL
jgi:hypothetical protein